MALTEVKQAGLDDEAVNESKLQISNAGTNGQYLQKQSGNTGGLTWADVPAGVGGATGLDLNDSVELRLGNSQDFRLYHDGTNTQIRNTTGLLTVGTDVFNVYAMSANEVMLRADLNSDVELYYDGVKKLETNADGIKVSGDIVADDNKLIKLGNDGDLKLYHSGVDSYIKDTGTGQLILQSDEFRVRNAAGNELIILADEDGAVKLYHDNSLKFETTNSGCKVTGQLLVPQDFVKLDDDVELYLGNGNDLQISHDGSNSRIKNTTGTLYVLGDRSGLLNAAETEWGVLYTANSSVELYYDGTKKLETASNGIQLLDELGLNDGKAAMFGNGDDLKIYHNGTHSYIWNTQGDLQIRSNSLNMFSTSGEQYFQGTSNGAVELYYNGGKKFETTNTGATVTGGTTAFEVTHTGGAAVRMTRNSKHFDLNANYAAADTHAALDVTSGMGIKFYTGGTSRMEITSSGHVLLNKGATAFAYRSLSNTHSNNAMSNSEYGKFSQAIVTNNNCYSTSNGRYTAPVAGIYYFYFNGLIDNDASSGSKSAWLHKNGSNTQLNFCYTNIETSMGYTGISGSAVINLSANDYVNVHLSNGWHVASETNWGGVLLG